MFLSINYLLVTMLTMEKTDITVVNTMDKKKHFKSLIGKVKKRQISTWGGYMFYLQYPLLSKVLIFVFYLNF